MAEPTSIMFEVGVIATVGFLGAALATRARVSVVIGYIVAGMLIGPNIHLDLFGLPYDGVLRGRGVVQSASPPALRGEGTSSRVVAHG